ncbi:MAG: hypothetical protein F4Y63_05735 [Chloroflexi bacterium]|nr:hypothetical protein [Chloroflexota bacterium]MYK61067.1 hypothetical protein [Chloroflexota bacterium]
MKNGNNLYPSTSQSEENTVGAGFKPALARDARDGNKPVIPANPPVIPAQAGIQRKTKHTAFLSPSRSVRGRAKRSGGAGDDRSGTRPLPSPSMGEGQGEGESGGREASDDDQPNLDVEAARKSMTRMANIFADIAKHAEDSSLTRCPYKDARSRCTAKFGCRNQHFTKNPLNPPICTAKDGDLDYRSAWEI